MLFKQTAVLAFLAATLAAAEPVVATRAVAAAEGIIPEEYPNLVVITEVPVEDGMVKVYGDKAIYGPDGKLLPGVNLETRELSSVEKRQCGSNNILCFSDNVPQSGPCNTLINSLENNTTPIPNSLRAICFTGNTGGTCCVSWASNVTGAERRNLVSAARSTLNQCVNGGRSGISRNTRIGQTCTTQCLSNRGEGCGF